MSAAVDTVQHAVHKSLTAIQYELCRRDMREFVKGAWPIVEPGAPFVGGFHIDAICDHLTYCSLGDIDDLVINIPPRHSKSMIGSVMWPAWEWTWWPYSQWMCATYAKDLTIRDSVKCRKVIQSRWYQERWGNIVKLTGDINQKMRFQNSENGYRLATSVGGQATGEGGSRILIDDAHNMSEVESDKVREGVISWWRDTMSTRGNDPTRLVRVIIAQRGHHKDLPGYCLSQGTWVHLNLPGYFVPKKRCVTKALKDGNRDYALRNQRKHVNDVFPPEKNPRYEVPLVKGATIFKDPRTIERQLLNPERFNQQSMRKISSELTERGEAAQIQQEPSIPGGNIIKRKWWRRWEDEESLPPMIMVIQSWDTAFEEGEEDDYSACTTWGVFEWSDPLEGDHDWKSRYPGQTRLALMLLHRWKDKVGFPYLRKKAAELAKQWKVDRILIEKKSSGHGLIKEMRRKGAQVGYMVRAIKVSKDKTVRTHSASLPFEQGCVFFVQRDWAKEVIDEVAEFPSGEYDDIHDTVTQAVNHLRELWMAGFADEDEPDDDYDQIKRLQRLEANRRKSIYGGQYG